MDENETTAANFFSTCILRPERIPESVIEGVRTPDFKVFSGNGFAFFAEVKTLSPDTRLDEALNATAPLQVVEVSESVYNRIASNIKNAGRQFVAINPNHEHPNVLVFVNKRECSVIDLRMVLEGIRVPGITISVIGQDAREQVQEGAQQIDAYVWLGNNEQNTIVFNPAANPALLHILSCLRQVN